MQQSLELLDDNSKDVKDGFRQKKKLFDEDALSPKKVVGAYPNTDSSVSLYNCSLSLFLLTRHSDSSCHHSCHDTDPSRQRHTSCPCTAAPFKLKGLS